jgi:hypothetical protein
MLGCRSAKLQEFGLIELSVVALASEKFVGSVTFHLKMAVSVGRIIAWSVACLGFLLMQAGCSGHVAREVPLTYQNLRQVKDAYARATDKLDRPPANLEELMPFLKEMGDPDALLKSTDDGEDFVILWGVDYRVQPAPVTIYEKTGKDGKRYVVRGRDIHRMNSEEFQAAPFPPGHQAPP